MKKQCVCKKGEIVFNNYKNLLKISSDEKFKFNGGILFACKTCGLIQKKVDADFSQKSNYIYNNYNAYSVAKGKENSVYIKKKNSCRSDLILNHINKKVIKLKKKKILDLGCGSGFTLKRVSELFPNNNLYAYDYDNKNSKNIKRIKNLKKFYTGNINKINNKFDLIILMHVFEHINNPINFLNSLKKKLNPGGVICIQSPNIEKNFLDILTFDHISHFSKDSLKILITKTLFCKIKFFNILKKEITCILFNSSNAKKNIFINKFTIKKQIINFQKKIDEINNFKNQITKIVNKNSKKIISIFGTTVPSIWIANEIGLNKVDNFIDEDKFKIGKKILNKKIINPKNFKNNSILVFPFRKKFVKNFIKKYQNLNGIIKSFS
jgi:2-polyprenyl-3-methyl-5-hydroxy-6-metoxy-1,4-benzoquinol methylase